MAPLLMETFHMTPYLQKSAQEISGQNSGKKEKEKKEKKESERFLQFALDYVKAN